jgi:hypothetical protein
MPSGEEAAANAAAVNVRWLPYGRSILVTPSPTQTTGWTIGARHWQTKREAHRHGRQWASCPIKSGQQDGYSTYYRQRWGVGSALAAFGRHNGEWEMTERPSSPARSVSHVSRKAYMPPRSGVAPASAQTLRTLVRDDFATHRVPKLPLDALVDVDEVHRTGQALELRRPRLPLGVEADFQRVPVDLVDAQHDRPLVRALGHGHIDGLR